MSELTSVSKTSTFESLYRERINPIELERGRSDRAEKGAKAKNGKNRRYGSADGFPLFAVCISASISQTDLKNPASKAAAIDCILYFAV